MGRGMNDKRIFILSGRQGSGKTTYAKYLQAFLGIDNTKILKFAEPLYALHDRCLPLLKEYGVRPESMTKDGELLQVLGTAYGREKLGQNVWVEIVARRAKQWLDQRDSHFVIIDDARFENEIDVFRADANLIRLIAPESVRKARCSYWREDTNHPSETSLDAYERDKKFDVEMKTEHETREQIEDAIEWTLKWLGYLDV